MSTIIMSKSVKLYIGKSQLPPRGYRMKHGIQLSDGRWIYEIEDEDPNVMQGKAFKKATQTIILPDG
jgi:hypothetical protein